MKIKTQGNDSRDRKRLGIIAGGGELPLIGVKEAIASGENPIIFSVIESDYSSDEYKDITVPFNIIKIGNFLKLCRQYKIGRLLLLGKVRKDIIFRNLQFDLKALSILARSINRNDYSIFKSLADEFEKNNIEIISQKTYLKSLLLPEGRYTAKKLTKTELADIEFGMEYAAKIASLDIGQTVVVLNKTVVAVEAVEGTDETIKRGANLAGKKGAVVCKSSKHKQDDRFDLPGIGASTLEVMKENGCSTLVFTAGESIIVNPVKVIAHAEKLKINLISLGKSGVDFLKSSSKKEYFNDK